MARKAKAPPARPRIVTFLDVQYYVERIPTELGYQRRLLFMFAQTMQGKYRDGRLQIREPVLHSSPHATVNAIVPITSDRSTLYALSPNLARDLALIGFWTHVENGEFRWAPSVSELQEQAVGRRIPNYGGCYLADSDPPIVVAARHCSGCRVTLLDLRNFLSVPWKRIAKAIGVRWLPRPADGSPDDMWKAYSRWRLNVLAEFWRRYLEWLDDYDCGTFKHTLSGQSFEAWQKTHSKFPVSIPRADSVKEIERQSYYGGRLDSRYIGQTSGPVWELDVQSMYGAIMRECPLPIKCLAHTEVDAPKDKSPFSKHYACIAEVLIDSDHERWPLRCKDATVWVTGRFWTTLAGPELQRAVDGGYVKAWGRQALYRLDRIATDYSDRFWYARQTARANQDGMREILAKHMLQRLWSKFGQLGYGWQRADWPCDPWAWGRRRFTDFERKETLEFRSVGYHCEQLAARTELPKSFPAISSFVASYAREWMYDLMTIAGPENTYYIVTDAIYVNREGYNRLQEARKVLRNTLGALQVKGYGEFATFHGPHHYSIGDKHVRGSLPTDADMIDDTSARCELASELRTVLAAPPLPYVDFHVETRTVSIMHDGYDIRGNGWVRPWRIESGSPSQWRVMRDRDKLPLAEDVRKERR